MKSVKHRVALLHELRMPRMSLNNPHTPQRTRRVLLGFIVIVARSSALAAQMLRSVMYEKLASH